MKLKKLTFLLLTLCLTLCLFTFRASAAGVVAEGTCGMTGSDIDWVLYDDGSLVITGAGEITNCGYNSDFYANSMPWYDYRDSIKTVTISGEITYIGHFAFYECVNLTTVSFPDTLTDIGRYTFSGCTGLTNVTLNEGLEYIGARAFDRCESLTSITIPSTIKDVLLGAFANSGLTEINILAFPSMVRESVFANTKLVNVTFPDNVWYIEGGAFSGCEELEHVVMLYSGEGGYVFLLDGGAFQSCYGMTLAVHTPWISMETGGIYSLLPYNCSILCYESTKVSVYDSTVGDTVLVDIADYAAEHEVNVCLVPDGQELCHDFVAVGATEPTCTSPGTTGLNTCQRCGIKVGTSQSISKLGHDYVNNKCTRCGIPATKVYTQPTTQKVSADWNTVSFHAVGTYTAPNGHSGPLTYQWQFKASANAKWKNTTAQGCNTTTLTVPVTASRSGYRYRCKITDELGNTVYTNAAFLYVLDITKQPVSNTVKEGETATFTVKATGHNKTYQWFEAGIVEIDGEMVLVDWELDPYDSSFSGVNSATLKVKAYRDMILLCRITDSAGNVVQTEMVDLTVKSGTSITSQPVGQKVKKGNTATFAVKATGDGLKYQWQYKNAKGNWVNATATGNKTATMKVKATLALSGRQYRCKITDSAGNVIYSRAVYLYVLGIRTQPTAKTVKAGTTAKFTVTAAGHNKTYQWLYCTPNGTWKNATAPGNKTATLKVSATAAKHGYRYMCRITDSAGNTTYTNIVTLSIKGKKAIEYPKNGNKYSISEAMAAGNAYAKKLGFTVAERSPENSSYNFTENVPVQVIDRMGGQDWFNRLAGEQMQSIADNLRGEKGNDYDLSRIVVWCYIEYSAEKDAFYIYGLFG